MVTNVDQDQNWRRCSLLRRDVIYALTGFVLVLNSFTFDETSRAFGNTQGKFTISLFSASQYTLPKNYDGSIPSIENPFIFFHQRKAGGSTVQKEINRTASELNLTKFLSCYSGVSCQTYYPPQTQHAEPVPIYGGHLHYPAFQKTLYLLHNKQHATAMINPPSHRFTCFTMFREPVSRIQSCWNYRMVQVHANGANVSTAPKLSSIHPNKIKAYLVKARSQYGEGCLNEPMRIFSLFGNDEAALNRLHEKPLSQIELAMNQTMERVSKCVVGILERCEDTTKALEKYLPFFAPYFSCTEHANDGKVAKNELNATQVKAIRDLTVYEDHVYQAANKILDIQSSSH